MQTTTNETSNKRAARDVKIGETIAVSRDRRGRITHWAKVTTPFRPWATGNGGQIYCGSVTLIVDSADEAIEVVS